VTLVYYLKKMIASYCSNLGIKGKTENIKKP